MDEVSPAVQFAALMGQYTADLSQGALYGMAQNLALDLRSAYDRALAEVDVLCLPTAPFRATPTPAPDGPVEDYIRSTFDMMENTSPFDTTGHPAISLPAPSRGNLPAGVMLVGRAFDEPLLLRAAAAYETQMGGAFPTPPKAAARGG